MARKSESQRGKGRSGRTGQKVRNEPSPDDPRSGAFGDREQADASPDDFEDFEKPGEQVKRQARQGNR